jgi:hypothetical protein
MIINVISKNKMLTQADKDFLTLEREQKALFRAQAQISSDISETSSQPAMEEDEEEIDLQIEVSETNLNHLPLEEIQEEISQIVVAPQQNQEQVLELLKSAFEQIKLALSLLNDQKLHQQIEELSQTLAPVAKETLAPVAKETLAQAVKEPVALVAKETFASKAKKPVAPVAKEPVAQVAKEPVASKATKSVASKATKSVAPVAKELVAIVAEEPVAPVAKETFAIVAEEPVASKATKSVAPVAKELVSPVAKETFAIVAEEPVASKATKSVAPVAKELVVQAVEEPVASLAVESFSKKVKNDEEFQVVLPKKSKIKNATIIVTPVTAFVVQKKNDFPSLGASLESSFSPVQKTGFWNSGKSSLEIAKSIAQIPSPPPTHSPSLLNTIKARGGSRGPIDEDNDFSDEEFEDDYWQ